MDETIELPAEDMLRLVVARLGHNRVIDLLVDDGLAFARRTSGGVAWRLTTEEGGLA